MSSSAILLKPHVLRISFTELKQPTFCRCQLMDIIGPSTTILICLCERPLRLFFFNFYRYVYYSELTFLRFFKATVSISDILNTEVPIFFEVIHVPMSINIFSSL